MRPSSFPTGWSPPARSMIDRRRAASPTLPSTNAPELSGPRWMSVSFIAARTSGSTAAPSSDTRPQMPHMALSVGRGPGYAARARSRPSAAHRAGQDAPRGRGADAQVEVDRAVRDVLEVVGELLRPGGLAGHPQLGEAGQARLDDQPLPVLRDLVAQLLEERGPDRPRPDDAHVARAGRSTAAAARRGGRSAARRPRRVTSVCVRCVSSWPRYGPESRLRVRA